MSPQEACEVCGRTFLVGERVHSYVSVEGRHEVCELCVDRVVAVGWLPADQEGAEELLRAQGERKPGFLGRFFSRPDAARAEESGFFDDERDAEEVDDEPRAPRRRQVHELETERYDVEAEWRDQEAEHDDVTPLSGRRSEWPAVEESEDEAAAPPAGRRSEWPASEESGDEAATSLPRRLLGRRSEEDRAEGARDEEGQSPVRRRLSRLFAARPRDVETEAPNGRAADLPAPESHPSGGDVLSPDLPHGHAAPLPSPDSVPEPEHSPAPAAPAPDPEASPAPLPDPAGRGLRPRRLQPDLSPATRFERAVARFNSSDAGRTAAGLTRTLGAPSVSVGDLAGEEDIVRITVAWELTWYQWGVDLGDELRPVFELEKGYEVSEIDSAARQWNASAHDGRIVMVAPPRREAEDGRPVHR